MGRLKENYFKKTKTKKGFCTNSARFKALSSDKNVSFLLAQGGPISYESFICFQRKRMEIRVPVFALVFQRPLTQNNQCAK